MALEIRSNADYQQFLDEFKSTDNKSEFHNKWFKFETYRKIVCTDNFWTDLIKNISIIFERAA